MTWYNMDFWHVRLCGCFCVFSNLAVFFSTSPSNHRNNGTEEICFWGGTTTSVACWKRFVAGTVAVPVFFWQEVYCPSLWLHDGIFKVWRPTQSTWVSAQVPQVEELLIGAGLLDRRFHKGMRYVVKKLVASCKNTELRNISMNHVQFF